ncbi:MAG: transcription factor S [archaeon GB-1867-005]|nr:transcription factor S [Candidatus Culexmicrobium cathedralense]
MKFCPKCGGLLRPKRSSDGVVELYCSRCNYSEPVEKDSTYKIVKEIKHAPDRGIIVVDESKLPKVLPTTRVECPRCGHNEAYWWMVQTRRADESPTRFFRCTRCGYTWREYD